MQKKFSWRKKAISRSVPMSLEVLAKTKIALVKGYMLGYKVLGLCAEADRSVCMCWRVCWAWAGCRLNLMTHLILDNSTLWTPARLPLWFCHSSSRNISFWSLPNHIIVPNGHHILMSYQKYWTYPSNLKYQQLLWILWTSRPLPSHPTRHPSMSSPREISLCTTSSFSFTHPQQPGQPTPLCILPPNVQFLATKVTAIVIVPSVG